jgi:hypothetical protein
MQTHISLLLIVFLFAGCKKDTSLDFRNGIQGEYKFMKCMFSNGVVGVTEQCDSITSIGVINCVGDSSLFFEGDTFTLSYQDNEKMRFWANNCSSGTNGQPTCLIDFFKPDSVFIVKSISRASYNSGTRWRGRKK